MEFGDIQAAKGRVVLRLKGKTSSGAQSLDANDDSQPKHLHRETLTSWGVRVLDASDGKQLKEFPLTYSVVWEQVMAVVDPMGEATLYDLETFDILQKPATSNLSRDGKWRVELDPPRRWGGAYGDPVKGLELVNVKSKAVVGSFNEPLYGADFSPDGTRVVVKTGNANLVVLEVPGAKEIARQPIPTRFELKRMVTPDIALGTVDQDWLLVRMDDGRRLWVRGTLREGKARLILHDDTHFTGDADGPVLLHRGGGWLTPDMVTLDQAPADLHRPTLVSEFFTKR